jgi:hypothetical protein
MGEATKNLIGAETVGGHARGDVRQEPPNARHYGMVSGSGCQQLPDAFGVGNLDAIVIGPRQRRRYQDDRVAQPADDEAKRILRRDGLDIFGISFPHVHTMPSTSETACRWHSYHAQP